MRYLPPIPWHLVTPGTVVLDGTMTPRAVVMNMPHSVTRTVLREGVPSPIAVRHDDLAQPVELDTADAIGNLFAAGFTVTPIEGN